MRYLLIAAIILQLAACNNNSSQIQKEDSLAWKASSDTISKTIDTIKVKETISTDSLEYINEYLNKPAFNSGLLETKILNKKLKKVLRSEYGLFMSLMQSASVLKKDGAYYTYSYINEASVKSLAYLIIDPSKDKIAIAIVVGRVRSDFESKGPTLDIPKELATALKKVGF